MGDTSKIEWTDATWNPVTGCTKVSPGCKFCYAETFAERWRGVPGHAYEQGFDVREWPGRVDIPLRWTKPRTIFVNSMSDLFQDEVDDLFLGQVFQTMREAHWHRFQVLTKRADRMRRFVTGWLAGLGLDPLPNVILGVSAENHEYWERRVYDLIETPAAARMVSVEPMLAPVRPSAASLHSLDWVIIGGESGHGARRMDLAWARGLVSRCRTVVPVFVKQLGAAAWDIGNGLVGAHAPVPADEVGLVERRLKHPKGGDPDEWPEDLRVREWPRILQEVA